MSAQRKTGAYIVLETGQKFSLSCVSVTHQFDSIEVTCLDDRDRRFARGSSRIMIEAEASGDEVSDPVKCGSCGSGDYRWHHSSGRVCSYCRTPA